MLKISRQRQRWRTLFLGCVSLVVLGIASRCSLLTSASPRYRRGRSRAVPVSIERKPAVPAKPVGTLPWPVEGEIVGSFGMRLESKYNTRTVSRGIDIKTQRGKPVSAVDSGVVSFADRFMGYGNTVIVEHAGRLHSVYSRLQEISVSVGDRLRQGQTVGVSGDTLHFELRLAGKPVDPLLSLRRR